MRAMIAATILACGAACCGTKPQGKLPTDLPPPEYEKPRGYDLPGASKTPGPAPTATPSAAPTAPPPPKP